nr:lysine-rich arabinogalactan protein 19-like [Aegilops tauschii subsp. strangulata]
MAVRLAASRPVLCPASGRLRACRPQPPGPRHAISSRADWPLLAPPRLARVLASAGWAPSGSRLPRARRVADPAPPPARRVASQPAPASSCPSRTRPRRRPRRPPAPAAPTAALLLLDPASRAPKALAGLAAPGSPPAAAAPGSPPAAAAPVQPAAASPNTEPARPASGCPRLQRPPHHLLHQASPGHLPQVGPGL